MGIEGTSGSIGILPAYSLRQEVLGYDPYPALEISSTATLDEFDQERLQFSLNSREYRNYFSSLDNFWDFFSEAGRAPFVAAGGVRARGDLAEFAAGNTVSVAVGGSYDPLQLIGGLVSLGRLGLNGDGLGAFAVQTSTGAWAQVEIGVTFNETFGAHLSVNPDGKNLWFVLENATAHDSLSAGAKALLITNPAFRVEWAL